LSEQEPSYYEIALTNRQVLVAFVILLCCVLAAFFAGVWVGRGSPAAAADAPLQAAAPQPTPSTETPQELAFFSDNAADPGGDRRPDLQELATKPRRDTTLAQDVGAPNAPTPAVPQPAASAAPAPAATAGGTAPAATAPAAAGTAAGPAVPAGPLFIQVFSSRDEVQARRLETRLRAAGFKAFLSPAGAMYRVRIGPFIERGDAETAAAKARRDFRVDTWITANP
jgi:cell division septation protein DedD